MRATPEGVVKRFVKALNRRDLDAAVMFINGGLIGPLVRQKLSEHGWPTLFVSSLETTVVGDLALVTFRLRSKGPGATQPLSEYLVLARTARGWLIDVPESHGGLGLMAYLLSNSPIMARAYASAQATACMRNVKSWATGLLLAMNDSDDILVTTVASWPALSRSYIDGEPHLNCPDEDPAAESYRINEKLIGVSWIEIDEPMRTVLVYEGDADGLTFRHDGRAAVAFADGSARLVNADESLKLFWSPGRFERHSA